MFKSKEKQQEELQDTIIGILKELEIAKRERMPKLPQYCIDTDRINSDYMVSRVVKLLCSKMTLTVTDEEAKEYSDILKQVK